jgi:hypothetical protein
MKTQQKWEKSTSNIDWWMAWSFGSKQNQTKTGKTTVINISWKGFSLVWGKPQKREKNKQNEPNTGKIRKNQNKKLAAYVSEDLVDHFFFCFGQE